MTVSTLPLPAFASSLSANRADPEIDDTLETADGVDSFALSDDEAGRGSIRDNAKGLQLTMADGLSMPAALRYPGSVRRELIQQLLQAVGPRLDESIINVAKLDPSEAKSIFQGAIASLANALHSANNSETNPKDAFQDYLVRLRIVRLFEACEGRLCSTVIYPLSGFDIVPALFANRLIGIDDRFTTEDFPQNKLQIVGDNTDEELQSMLTRHFSTASRMLGRFVALTNDVFSKMVEETLSLCDGRNRLLFLKGMDWMRSPHARKEEKLDLALRQLITLCINPGDIIAVWDRNTLLHSSLRNPGLCEEMPLGFLPGGLAAKVQGTDSRTNGQIISLGSDRYDGKVCFVIPHTLRLYRRVR